MVACVESPTPIDVAPPIALSAWANSVDTLAGTYTALTSAAEMWDTVLVTTDIKEGFVWRTDIGSDKRRVMGSKGNGPGEYQSPGQAVKISSDSIALLNLQSPQFAVISAATGRGRTHWLYDVYQQRLRVTGSMSVGAPLLRYADTLGNIYGAPIVSAPRIDKRTGRRDVSTMSALASIPIVRYSLLTRRVDTLLYVSRGVAPSKSVKSTDGTQTREMSLGAYGAFNDWLVTADGRLLIANAEHYTLTVRDAAGADSAVHTYTWQIPGKQFPTSVESWNDFVKKSTHGANDQIARINQRVFARIGEAPPVAMPMRYIVPPKPRVLPYLDFGDGQRHMHESGGVVWVPVHMSDLPHAEYWDLIDLATGTRLTSVAFPPKQYLLHVTARGAFVLAVDDDDLERVLLYRRDGARLPVQR